MCKGLIELATHLLSLNHEYVMSGIFTTDYLEKEFGKLRQGSGRTYFITIQQIMEKVAIKKNKAAIKFKH